MPLLTFSTKLDVRKIADLVAYWQMKGLMPGTRSMFIRAIVDWVWESLSNQNLLPRRHMTTEDALRTLSNVGLHVAQAAVNRETILDALSEDDAMIERLRALQEQLSASAGADNAAPDTLSSDNAADDFDPNDLDWGSNLRDV